eukprot:gnl/TRDRNA2_/TRDRNA2_199606_c0_seq1.p1 gnl/TRDRNA2_/TRDRNA2_199606_c0~~gnl/TRDRNA2_/TRDRNA2_199606_c0_seq1.p1  ORF type:complete len:433 (-),score=55.18 gnl/TRDRNA2_/TRDRNA2_199606_c0_seq1:64-1362(-)
MPPVAAPGAVLVIDNGGGVVKAGLATCSTPPVLEPNFSAVPKAGPKSGTAPVVCSGIRELPSYTLSCPTQRGLLLDLEQERMIWDFVLRRRLSLSPGELAVLATEAPLTPDSVRRDTAEVLFETFGFQEVCLTASTPCALHSPGLRNRVDERNPCCTVLDVGHSASIALPCVDRQMLNGAVRRLNVGGRVLTNLLMERLKLRHFDLSGSWLLVEDILAAVGEVSSDFDADLYDRFQHVAPKTYCLPDFRTCQKGFLEQPPPPPPVAIPAGSAGCAGARDGSGGGTGQMASSNLQRMTLQAERVVVPEMLFRPADQGVRQAGVAELVQRTILEVRNKSLQPHLGQVVLCGGLARLPGFRSRLWRELRALLPTTWDVAVVVEPEPELSIWRGAAQLAQDPGFRKKSFQTRRSWEEEGRLNKRKANHADDDVEQP